MESFAASLSAGRFACISTEAFSLTDIKTRVGVELSELPGRRRGDACAAVDDQRRPLFVPEETSVNFRTSELD